MANILCIGMSGSGKSMLLHCLKERCHAHVHGVLPDAPGPVDDDADGTREPPPLLAVVPTVGADLVRLQRPGTKKNSPVQEVLVREVGGSMSPIWKNFLEAGGPANSHRALLYVVDVGAPEMVGSSTIHLLEILDQCQMMGSLPVMVVFTKTDLVLARPLHEIQAADLEETIKRIQAHKGVIGMMIVNNDGVAVRTTMDATMTNQYCAVISRLSDQARSAVRDLDPTNDITFLRLRSKKNEILIAPDRDFILVVIQSPTEA